MNARDEAMETIEHDFSIRGGGDWKLEFTGMKSTMDQERKQQKKEKWDEKMK